MRFRDIEFRWSEVNNKYELVKLYPQTHGEISCVVAFFDKGKEGYDMRTIGNRFFEDKDAFVVGKYAIEFLNETFEIERQEEDNL